MAKLIALHALHLASAVPGVIDVIDAGKSFDSAEHDNVEMLLERGAVRKATSDDKSVRHFDRALADGQTTVAPTGEELAKLTKAQLLALAEKEEVDVSAAKTNAEIVSTIEAARAQKQDDLV